MDIKKQETDDLIPVVRNRLMENGLIGSDETIRLIACHDIVFNNEPRNHYIIQCSKTGNSYFLKLQKNVDNIIHCDEYIQAAYQNEDFELPHILVSPFPFHNDMFFITNYVEGYDLETLDSDLSDTQWEKAANDIRKQLILLSNIHTPYYSERNKFFTGGYPNMFIEKLKTRGFSPPSIRIFPYQSQSILIGLVN